MNKKVFRLSPGAPSIVLIVVVLSMSIMGMLMYVRAGSDLKLSLRSVQVAGQDAALFEKAEDTFARLDALALSCREKAADPAEYRALLVASLPEGMEMEENLIFWQETEGGRTLYAGAALGAYEDEIRITWHTRMLEAEVGETWNIF